MSTDIPIVLDWPQLRGVDPLPARIIWERDGKEMALIPPGSFTMGATGDEARRLAEEWEYAEACSKTLLKGIPNSRLVIFEESAHVAHLEETERYLQIVTKFLEETESGSG